MTQRVREFNCLDCGKLTRRRCRADKPNVCFDCGVNRAVNSALEMNAKSGPAWDRFLKSPGRYPTDRNVPE